MRSRIVLVAALATAALVASSAQAARAPQITDPKGDALASQAAYDIVSVTLDTPRTTKSKTSPIKTFSITMELAAAPDIHEGTSYQINADLGDCGSLFVFSYWSALDAGPTSSFQIQSCGQQADAVDGSPQTFLDPTVKIEGNKITWAVSGKAMPKEFAKGYLFNSLYGYTAITEPLVGYTTEDYSPAPGTTAIDATKTISYKYGS